LESEKQNGNRERASLLSAQKTESRRAGIRAAVLIQEKTGGITSMFETANNLSVQISSFEDLAIVSTSGTISSYLSGYSYSIFPYLSDNEIFSADNVSRGFLFFTDEENSSLSGWFLYYFPLQDFVIGSTTTSQKTATAFFLFNLDTLSGYLRTAKQENAGCELLYEGVPVCGVETPEESNPPAEI